MAPLKAKILISSILLIVLLMLPDEATSQRRRRGMIAPNTAQNDSLHGNDSLKADTVTVLHGCTIGELARMINGEGFMGSE